VRRSLASLGQALAAQLTPARTTGWLAGCESRAKIIAATLLIVCVSLLHGLPALTSAAVLALAMALAAGLRGRKLAPVWLGVPLFTLAIALPATLNLITPGRALWVLFTPAAHHLGPWPLPAQITVTLPGLLVAARFFLRTLACVTLALTLTGTTDPVALVTGLRRLGLPRVFGMVLTMMQRYLVLVLRRAEELHLAKLSRTPGVETVRQGQRWAAAGMGLLLLSSLRTAEGVHTAMIARGYDGDIQTLPGPRWSKREAFVILAAVTLSAVHLITDRLIS
jgi:cobalt/nickel transport system permease protein